jgi:DNA-binding SARP family transcriptional activator
VPRPPPLQLVAVGPPAVRVDGAPAPAEVLWRKHFALLVYLALSPGLSRSRAHLLAMLWPERSGARARHSLNEALHRLRSCLGAGRLITEGETVTLSGEDLAVDAWREEGDQDGEFLEAFTLEDSQPFDEWVENERRRRRESALSALVQQARRLLAEGMAVRAVAVARTARERDPLNEAAVRVLMEALALAGDGGGALAELRDYRKRLAEFGEAPDSALTGLADRIRSGHVPAGATAGPALPVLVGRAAALATLSERLPLPGLTPARVLIVLGEGGEGKTRLLKELERRATLAGITVAGTRALPSDQGRPRSTLRGLFRGGLLRAPGLLGVDPVHLRRLASAVPELTDRFPPQTPEDDGELGYSLAEALNATAEDSPLLLLLDDAHLADGTSLGVLQAALERLTGNRVALALTAAPHDPDSAPELFRLESETGRGLPGTTVGLGPFGPPELAALIEELAPWAEPGAARDRLVRRLLHETFGNPFLAVTLLRGLADIAELRERAVEWPVPSETLEAPLPHGVPHLIQSAVLAQVARLGPASRETLAVAATLGTRLDVPLLAAVTGLSEVELAERLALPERLQLIAATEEGYGFPGAVVATVLKHVGLTPGRRRELRGRAAALLAERSDFTSRLWRLELLAGSAHHGTVAAEAIDLGETLLARGDRHGARRAVRLVAGPSGEVPESSRAAWLALRDRLDGEPTG